MKNISNLQQNYALAPKTSWKIGGTAEYFYEPVNLADLKSLLSNWKIRPITVLGAGTNILVRDEGIKGLVIYLKDRLHELQELDNFTLRAEAGVGLARLVQRCLRLGMIDAAFLTGIPGTVGGALAMNAGSHGDYIWNHVTAVETINSNGEVKLRSAQEFMVNYRQVVGLAAEEWFVAAQLVFVRGDKYSMEQQVGEYLRRRKKSQPLDLPSCGSVFRNPPNNYAARLIEASGLKGKKIGEAKISDKHANFIVNCGGATAVDVETLMQEVVDVVAKNYGIRLVPEVHILGD